MAPNLAPSPAKREFLKGARKMTERHYDRLSSELIHLYDQYRTAQYNVLYYGKKLNSTRKKSRFIDGVIALTAPGTMGFWIVLGKVEWGITAAQILGTIAAIAAIAKTIYNISDNIQKYTRLHTTYNEITAELEQLVEKVKRDRDFVENTRIRFDIQVKRMGTLSALDDPEMDPAEEERCYATVNEQIPPGQFWLPSPETQ